MKIVCISNSIELNNGDTFTYKLTIGKQYDIIEHSGKYYRVEFDDGTIGDFPRGRFTTVEKWRESKLNEIFKCM